MTETSTETTDKKYIAFISYSHRDDTWGRWLHKGIETYRVPRSLVGTPGRDGRIPPRPGIVFRDREELPTSHDLSEQVVAALKQSNFLVVICSPNAARSRWVNQEILDFKAAHGESRVLAVIVAGDPNATDRDLPDEECFPEALRYRVDPSGARTDERTEPIAADARPGRDGRRNALLKILAGLLGVGFDQLKQRDRVRQRRRRLVLGSTVAVVAALVGISSIVAIRSSVSEAEAVARSEEDRATAEGLSIAVAAGAELTPLIEAVLTNDVAAAEKAIADGALLDETHGNRSQTVLMFATRAGHESMTRWLLEKGASTDVYDSLGYAAIHLAADGPNPDILNALQEHGVDVDKPTGDQIKMRPIGVAAMQDNSAAVERLLDLGSPINKEISYEWGMGVDSALNWAAGSGRMDMVAFLISRGSDPLVGMNANQTSVDYAMMNGRVEIAIYLIDVAAKQPHLTSRSVNRADLLTTAMIWALNRTTSASDDRGFKTLLNAGGDPWRKIKFMGGSETSPFHEALSRTR